MGSLFDLSGRVIWAVGGGGFLGTEVSLALAAHGATVVVADVSQEAAEAACQAVVRAGGQAEARVLDLADEAQVVAQAEDLRVRYGRIDGVVNMTARSTGQGMFEMSAAAFEAGNRITLTGAFVLSREAARVMVAQGTSGSARKSAGSIIHFASMYGLVSPDPAVYPPTQSVNPIDYGAAKAGVVQMTRYQAVMLGRQGVRVNCIAPGPFPNPAKYPEDPGFLERLAAKVPMGRCGRAEEIAGAVVYLASDASSFTTGSVLTVDGGWTAV